jgi:predicted PurR-regulated permease PerM
MNETDKIIARERAYTGPAIDIAIRIGVVALLIAILDNLLKPILLGRGAPVPMLVIFLGAIGGFLSMGFMGLFVGAVILSIGFKLFRAWLDELSDSNTSKLIP